MPDVLPIVFLYLACPGNSVGGNLHILLHDQNVSDSDVEFCRSRAEKADDVLGVKLALVLARMSRTQRLELATECWRGGYVIDAQLAIDIAHDVARQLSDDPKGWTIRFD